MLPSQAQPSGEENRKNNKLRRFCGGQLRFPNKSAFETVAAFKINTREPPVNEILVFILPRASNMLLTFKCINAFYVAGEPTQLLVAKIINYLTFIRANVRLLRKFCVWNHRDLGNNIFLRRYVLISLQVTACFAWLSCIVGRPSACWTRMAEGRTLRRNIGEASVQQWTSVGWSWWWLLFTSSCYRKVTLCDSWSLKQTRKQIANCLPLPHNLSRYAPVTKSPHLHPYGRHRVSSLHP